MTRAEEIFSRYMRRLQQNAISSVHTIEREMLIELVRALDHAAFAITLAPNRAELLERDHARKMMLLGAAPALRPFLEHLKNQAGGVPWQPTRQGRINWAEEYLIQCGLLLHLQRLAACERFGLCSTKFIGKKKLLMEVQEGGAEEADRAAGSWFQEPKGRHLEAMQSLENPVTAELMARIDDYVGVQWDWFIRYESDQDLMAFYRSLASTWASDCAESEALPDQAVIAGRSFAEWRNISETAFGRILHHISFATRLRHLNPHLEMRNLLSIYARKDDIAAVWEGSGEQPQNVEGIMRNLLLDADTVGQWEAKYEIPLPYYIDLGRDFVMLPLFGGLLNAHAGLAWALRDRYRNEWNTLASGREEVFRSDLRRIFPAPRFLVSGSGVALRREDGSLLTDIDAVVFDHETKEVGLFQLKWYDAVGYSLGERDSRRRNLLEANQWVERVAQWLDSYSLSQVLGVLGISADGMSMPRNIFVLVRNEIRFTGNERYDSRAAWLRWSEFARAVTESKSTHILSTIWRMYRHEPPRPRHRGRSKSIFQLPELTVEIRIS